MLLRLILGMALAVTGGLYLGAPGTFARKHGGALGACMHRCMRVAG